MEHEYPIEYVCLSLVSLFYVIKPIKKVKLVFFFFFGFLNLNCLWWPKALGYGSFFVCLLHRNHLNLSLMVEIDKVSGIGFVIRDLHGILLDTSICWGLIVSFN